MRLDAVCFGCGVVFLALGMIAATPGAVGQDHWPFNVFKQRQEPSRVHQRLPASPPPRRTQASTSEPLVEVSGGETAAWHWRITKAGWTETDETAFEDFVARIGESGCRNVHTCLTGAASNPMYHASNPAGMTFYADCADLPYMLRAYFAWKNGLPFSYTSAVLPIGSTRDIRYTRLGNRVIGRHHVVGPVVDARRAIPRIVDTISSAHYRYPPRQTDRMLPDHYPVAITPRSIRPGTLIYDPNGHVAVVYKVGADGRIHYIDTHPDNSLTRGVYGRSFVRSSPGMGAGFKRWRPQRLVGANRDENGYLAGGEIVLAADRDIPDWSDEQVYGNAGDGERTWQRAKFVIDRQGVDYYEFVRKRLAGAGFRYNPIDETREMVRTLCGDAKYRVDAVNVAIKAGIHLRPQPPCLPLNIYGSEGEWEIYSTPSRDARLKTAFKELRDEIARYLSLAATDPDKIDYAGGDLKADLARIWRDEASACRFSYERSDKSEVVLDLHELQRRLFALSFDPYHCPERRWGAGDQSELSTCPDGPVKRAWYEAEQRLRNQIERTYDTRMGFFLRQLREGVPGSGVDRAPETDVTSLLGGKSALRR
jgi:hypothetical protein